MYLQLGKPVVSSDGVHLGTVDRLILDPDMKGFREFIVHRGVLFAEDRLVEEQFIAGVDEDGTVRLTVSAEEERRLPLFAAHEYIAPTGEAFQTGPYPIGTASGPTVLLRSTYTGSGYQSVTRGLGEPAPAEGPTMEMRSNLPDDAAAVGAHTEVISSDARRIGTVDEIVYDEDGEIQELIVKAGFFTHHPVRVARKDIASLTHDEVRLAIPLAAVEATGTAAQSPATGDGPAGAR